MKSILIVDDHEDIRLLIMEILKHKYSILQASNVEQTLTILLKQTPDIIILDIGLPDGDGFQLCSEIRDMPGKKDIPLIFLTAKRGINAHIMGYRVGGDHYLEKPFDENELLAIVENKLTRFHRALDEIDCFADLRIDRSIHKVYHNEKSLNLSPLEYKILSHFIKNAGVVFSRERLIQKFWSDSTEVNDRAVDNHIGSIRRKLINCNCVLKSVYSEGYLLEAKD